MQPLINGQPSGDECWEEWAEHSFTHSDVEAVEDETAAA